MIVTVTPNPGLDVTYVLTSAVEDGDVRRADRSTVEASGKGVNVSRALHRAGAATVAVYPSGGRTGQFLGGLLQDEGVPQRAVGQAGEVRVNTSALLPGGQTLKLNGPGSPLTAAEQEALLEAVAQVLADAGPVAREPVWLAVCGSLPPRTAPSLVARLVAGAHEHRALCAVDASGPALAAAVGAGADLLAPNRHELGEIAPDSRAAVGVDDVVAHARTLAGREGVELLVSLGEQGAVFTDGRIAVHARGPALVPVNTAGAGDALLAGWLRGEGEPVQRLLRAVRWGRSACLAETTVDPAPGAGDTADLSVRLVEG